MQLASFSPKGVQFVAHFQQQSAVTSASNNGKLVLKKNSNMLKQQQSIQNVQINISQSFGYPSGKRSHNTGK